MKSSLLSLGLLLAMSCGTMAQTPSDASVSAMTNIPELVGTSIDYGDNTNSETVTEEQPIKNVGATTPVSTTTTQAYASPKCPPCLLDLTMEDHSMFVIGGLALGCLVLFMTTMVLACKVCCLQRERGQYKPRHTDSHLANGKKKTEVGEPDETAVMMTEVFHEDETADEERGRKEDNVSTGSKGSSERKEGAGENDSDTIKGAANDDQKQPESNADEASKSPTASETTDVTDGPKSAAEEPANSSTEGTAATQEPGSEG